MIRWKTIPYKTILVRISKAVNDGVSQEHIIKMLSDAEKARERRNVSITNEQTYMIRFSVKNRKVAVLFLNVDEEMRAVMMYNEELKQFLDETGHDFTQLSGNPLE